MPLYDCVLLLKPQVKNPSLRELIARVGKHVYARNGVLTEIKSFGTVHLGYGIKKLDGRYFQFVEVITLPGDFDLYLLLEDIPNSQL
uniref:Ribosomal protein S6 n=1 Tax=Chenopodium quinoa TaxID=63459 RepID=A0A803KPX4_CHEQI